MSKAKAALCVFIVTTLAKQNLDDCDNDPSQVDLFRNGVGAVGDASSSKSVTP